MQYDQKDNIEIQIKNRYYIVYKTENRGYLARYFTLYKTTPFAAVREKYYYQEEAK